jgi:3',5'-cyclic AMP phosphodiesterase CpdA
MRRKRWDFRFLVLSGLLAAIFFLSSQAEALRFVVYGDSRSDNKENPVNEQVLNQINEKIIKLRPQPEFVIFGGDMAYRGGRANFEKWKDLLKAITDQGIKLYIAIGNHELYKEPGEDQEESSGLDFGLDLDNQKEFQQVFDFLPANGPNEDHKHLAYTFTSADGDSFFVVLATYYVDPQTKEAYDGKLDPAQMTWVEKELAKSTATHKFVISHRPVFSTGGGEPESTLKELWQIMDNNRADIYFSGHEHLYCRKTIDVKMDPGFLHKVVQVIDGSCGAPLSSGDDVKVNKRQWHVKLTYNYSVVDVNDCQVTVRSFGWHDPNQPQNPELGLIDGFKRKTVDCQP